MQLLRVAALAVVLVCAIVIAWLFGGSSSTLLSSARSRAAVRKSSLDAAVADAMAADGRAQNDTLEVRDATRTAPPHAPQLPPSTRLRSMHTPQLRPLRWMFVGDSITEGIAPGSAKRFRVPHDGSCSYRFDLLRLLCDVLGNKSIATVGPYHDALGGTTPSRCCDKVRLRRDGSRSVADGGVGDGMGAAACIARYGQHGGIWGGEFQDFLNSTSDQLYAKRYQAYRSYFRKRAARFAAWAIESPEALRGRTNSSGSDGLRAQRSPLQRWAAAFQPDVVLILTGTNDLYVNAEPLDMCRAWFPLMLHRLLTPPSAAVGEQPPMVIGISTLLLRIATDVGPLNRLMLAIRACKEETNKAIGTHISSLTAEASCRACVGNVLAAQEARDRATPTVPPASLLPPPPSVDWGVWCHYNVHVLHVGRAALLPNTSAMMYDGLHPSEAGELALASVLMDEMRATGMLQRVQQRKELL